MTRIDFAIREKTCTLPWYWSLLVAEFMEGYGVSEGKLRAVQGPLGLGHLWVMLWSSPAFVNAVPIQNDI